MKNFSRFFLIGAMFLAVFALAGCQSVEDKIAQSIAEQAVESALGGKVKLDTSDGGETVKITTPEGEAVFGGGDTRPESVHPDLPNLEGASDFSWAGSKEGGMFTYGMKGADFKDVCKKQMELLAGAGWKVKEDFMMEFEGMMTRTMEKTGYGLSVSCSADKEENLVTVVMIKGEQE